MGPHQSLLYFALLFVCAVAQQQKERLQFNSDGKFKVLQFTDLHFGGNPQDDLYTLAVQGKVLTAEHPDLVVITGDLVTGYLWNKKDKNFFYDYWNQLIQPMVARNIKWAIALGNHDAEGDLTGDQIIQLDSSHELSMTRHGLTSIKGDGNYDLPIYINSSSNEVGHVLWFLDSGHINCMNVPGWGCIDPSQINWYKNQSAYYTNTSASAVPGIAFFHLWNTQDVYGSLAEEGGICCSSANTGMFTAMKEMGDIKYVFCGHDHNNDFYGNYYGVNLGYGRKTGYGSYGPLSGVKHGARVLEISVDGTVDTWIRAEDGSVEIQGIRSAKSKHSQWTGCCGAAGHVNVQDFSSENLFFCILVIMALVVSFIGYIVGKGLYEQHLRKNQTRDSGVLLHNLYKQVATTDLTDC